MDLKRAINIQNAAYSRIQDIYRTARTMGYKRDYIQVEINRVFTNLPKNFSIMRRDMLRMVSQTLNDITYERDLEFCYSYKDDIYSTDKKSTHFRHTSEIDPKELHHNHYGFAFFWKDKGVMFNTNWNVNEHRD